MKYFWIFIYIVGHLIEIILWAFLIYFLHLYFKSAEEVHKEALDNLEENGEEDDNGKEF